MKNMKRSNDSEAITLGDRTATAILSGIVALITVGCYFLILRPPAVLFREFVASHACLMIIGAAVVLGFVLGSTRMANVFSVFWGTSGK